MQTIRVSLPTYNALTDNNPDHFALYSDQDWVLIKELGRGSFPLGGGLQINLNHNLGYIPFVLVFGQEPTNSSWANVVSYPTNLLNAFIEVSTTQLIVYNLSASQIAFKYYVFYDQIV